VTPGTPGTPGTPAGLTEDLVLAVRAVTPRGDGEGPDTDDRQEKKASTQEHGAEIEAQPGQVGFDELPDAAESPFVGDEGFKPIPAARGYRAQPFADGAGDESRQVGVQDDDSESRATD